MNTTLSILTLVAQLHTEAAAMRQPDGEVTAELANQIAAATINGRFGRTPQPEPYAASLLGLVTALEPLEAKGWFTANRYADPATADLVAELRHAIAIGRRHLGIAA